MSTGRANLDAYFRTREAPGPLKASVGDAVMWTRYHLRQTGRHATDPVWRQEGRILELDEKGPFALVQWSDEEKPRLVALANLAHDPKVYGPNRRHAD